MGDALHMTSEAIEEAMIVESVEEAAAVMAAVSSVNNKGANKVTTVATENAILPDDPTDVADIEAMDILMEDIKEEQLHTLRKTVSSESNQAAGETTVSDPSANSKETSLSQAEGLKII